MEKRRGVKPIIEEGGVNMPELTTELMKAIDDTIFPLLQDRYSLDWKTTKEISNTIYEEVVTTLVEYAEKHRHSLEFSLEAIDEVAERVAQRMLHKFTGSMRGVRNSVEKNDREIIEEIKKVLRDVLSRIDSIKWGVEEAIREVDKTRTTVQDLNWLKSRSRWG